MKLIITIQENSLEERVKYVASFGKEKYVAFGKTQKIAFKNLIKILEEEFFKTDHEL